MSEEKESPEQILWALTPSMESMLDQAARNDRVYDAVAAALGRIAREQYPEMNRWSAAQLRELAEVISRGAQRYWMELDEIDARSEDV